MLSKLSFCLKTMAETKSSDKKDIVYCGNCGKEPVIVPGALLCSTCYTTIKMEKGFNNTFIKQTDAAYAAINFANCKVCKTEPVLHDTEMCKKCLNKDASVLLFRVQRAL